ncbi:serine/threonine-protein kinase Sgk3-like [Petromyzon marinus]|uniref:serine/threonine-protein kinase Sgk3-like n=1 Tax=Petromyzon marinus TaxID=7757 RepID=UPI003F6FD955
MDADRVLPSVHINSSKEDTDHRKKRFTVYKMMVCNGGQSWFVFRRYAEFDKLYNTLKKQCPNMTLKIPAKRIFGNNFDPDFIKQRREGLEEFIQKLMSTPELCQTTDVQDFLKMDNPRNKPDFHDVGIHSDMNNGSEEINLGPSGDPLAKPSDFNFLNVLGKGSFGKVLLARHKVDEKFYAVKVLQKSVILQKNEQRHVMAERNVLLKNCNHPFLVALHYSFQTNDKLYFVLDYVNGGELFFHLQRERTFPEHRARFYAAEIASAIGYLHCLNIIYRDLKPENILLDSEGHIKLTDFGLCKEGMESTETTTTFCGTPEYLAPEILRKEPYDRTVDWWCLGSVLYEMLFGLPPFYCRDVPTMYDDILHKPLLLRHGSPAAHNILEGLLQKEKRYRLGSHNDFKDIKEHVFFISIDWLKLDAKKVVPPFNPKVDGPDDLRHFDPEFTEECVTASISQPVRVSVNVIEADDAFLGFSYVPPSNSFL